MKNTKLLALVGLLSTNSYSAIPTKVGNLNIQSDDIIGTVFELIKIFFYYGAWIAIGVSLIVGVYTIIGALGESRKKGDTGILWSAISSTMVVVVIVIVIAIFIISFMDINSTSI
jgi:heme/copper-type cytochrome/quinol oxidase subunit 2